MTTPVHAQRDVMPGLYRRLLGNAWDETAPAVRAAHVDGVPLQRTGMFQVTRGPGIVGRCLAAVMRLPLSRRETPTVLRIEPTTQGERWIRTFSNRRVVTTQWGEADGVLCERMGMLELHFRLGSTGGAIEFHQIAAWLRLGPIAISLPHVLQPKVEAREEAIGLDRTRVQVCISLPLVGRLISYGGELDGGGP